jgi:hypothetical protein
VYRRIIRYYLRYVLVRCAKFTNHKGEAQTIAFYSLVIARDQIRQKSKTRWEQDTPTDAIERLLGDETMQKLAQAMNMLDGFTRELLVLHHIEMMGVRQLSQLFERPAAEITAQITAGQEALATHLQQLCSNHSELQACDVASLLDEFRACLEPDSAERLGRYALSYVTNWEKNNRPAPPCGNMN